MTVVQQANKYFICLKADPLNPIPWQIPDVDESVNVDCVYFGKVFAAMEEKLNIKGLTFYLTWNVKQLPTYGQDVVAVVLGDEWCRIPKYAHKIRAVFKSYGIHPALGCNPLLTPSYLNFLTLVQFIKNSYSRLPSWLNYKFNQVQNLLKREIKSVFIYDIPLGYYNLLELPIKDFASRPYDVFFAGSISFKSYSRLSLRYWLQTPKILARQQMLASIKKFQAQHPEIKFNVSITPSFGFQGDRKSAAQSYSKQLMNAKICLVPRGSSWETFRFFEGLKYGCIVISEALPRRWFYNDSPAIILKDWSELDKKIASLIHNEQLMQQMHKESWSWWENKCSETAVGNYIAENLNSLP